MGFGEGQALRAGVEGYAEQERAQQRQALDADANRRANEAADRDAARETREAALFEQQQALMNDETARMNYMRDVNAAMAIWKATGGQVWQPMVDHYNNKMPDGGQITKLLRNDDGTFSVEFDYGGSRQSSKMTKDELGSVFMALADPQGFLQAQAQMAEEARIHEQAMQLAKARKGGGMDAKGMVDMRLRIRKAYEDTYPRDQYSGERAQGAPTFEQFQADTLRGTGLELPSGDDPANTGPQGQPRSTYLNSLIAMFRSPEAFRAMMARRGQPYDPRSGETRHQNMAKMFLAGEEPLREKIIRSMAPDLTDEEVAKVMAAGVSVPAGQENRVTGVGMAADAVAGGVGSAIDAAASFFEGGAPVGVGENASEMARRQAIAPPEPTAADLLNAQARR